MNAVSRRALLGSILTGGGLILAGCLDRPTEGDLEGDLSESAFEAFVEDKSAAEAALETTQLSIDLGLSGDGQEASVAIDGEVNRIATVASLDYDVDAPGPAAPWRPRGEFDTYFDDSALYYRSGTTWERYAYDEFEDLESEVAGIWSLEELTVDEELYHYGDVTVSVGDDEILVTTECTGRELEAVGEGRPEQAVPGLDEVDGGAVDRIVFEESVEPETHYPNRVSIDGAFSDGDHEATMDSTIEFDDHDGPAIDEVPEQVRSGAVDGERPTPF